LLVLLERKSAQPLHTQLEAQIRDAIRGGRLTPGTRLPSTRTLAGDLRITRGVVVEAYEQLVAGGYVVSRGRQGTIVAPHAGDEAPSADQIASAAPARFNLRTMAVEAGRSAHPDAFGAAGHVARELRPEPTGPRIRFDFRYGAPDLSVFPRRQWLAGMRDALRNAPDAALNYGDPRGTLTLREELARYLNRARGTFVTPDAMLTTDGTVQAMALLSRTLRARGATRIAVEDPGWPAQAEAVRRAGLQPVAVPVDDGGIDVGELARIDPDAVFITPAHQFPTGAALAPERRGALIAWAEDRGAVILEDDYDAEYRYDRDAVPALQGMAPAQVVYAGSISKTLAPAMRIGWLAAPAWLMTDLAAELRADHRMSAVLGELAFAHLLAHGEFDRHIRRTRQRYRRRRDALVSALDRHLPDAAVRGVAAGLHALVELPPGVDEGRAAAGARAHGIGLAALSELRSGDDAVAPALLLSYAALPEAAIQDGVRELALAIGEATVQAVGA
jgi:GntR family transcriptional regulator/MocR family aminotransferase